MRLLLDTHTLIWVFDSDQTLSPAARRAIVDGRNEVYASAASAWEIAIKRGAGKLVMKADYLDGLRVYRLASLAITAEHALAVEDLPLHHRDPFDRLLIAQAQVERLTVVTRDPLFADYDVDIIKA